MYEELFYWMSDRLLRVKSNEAPYINALILLTLLQLSNLLSVGILLDNIFRFNLTLNALILLNFILYIILHTINYFTFYKKKQLIFEKYKDKKPKRKIYGLIYFFSYCFLSLIVFFYLASIHNP